jgi:hypothetical protein
MLVTGYTSPTVLTGQVSTSFSTTSYAPGYWGVSVTTLTGLRYLEASTVSALSDGGTDYPLKVVSNGSITLSYNAFVVNVGLPYNQTVMTLPPEAGSQRGTSQGKRQRISEIALKLNNSYRGFQIAGNLGNLNRVSYRNPATLLGTPEPLFTGVLANIPFKDDYQYGAQVLIQNSDPLPMEILSIIGCIETFDK